jgi:hypothetical protein
MVSLKSAILTVIETHPDLIKIEGLPIIDFLISKIGGLSLEQVGQDLDWLEEFDELNSRMDVPAGSAAKMANSVYLLKDRRKCSRG